MNTRNFMLAGAMLAAQFATSAAQAQDPEPFEASIALGYVATTGNTSTKTYNSDILLTYRTEHWTHNGKFQGLGSQEDGITKAERYYLEDKSDFNLDNDRYVFGKGSYTDDRFSGYDYQAAVSTGYGRYLLKSDDMNLQAFGGVGYRQNAISTGNSEGEAILTLGENFDWKLSENASVVQSLTSDVGADLTITRFEIGLIANIINRVATKLAFQARNTSVVPAGNKETDTQTSVSLVYTF